MYLGMSVLDTVKSRALAGEIRESEFCLTINMLTTLGSFHTILRLLDERGRLRCHFRKIGLFKGRFGIGNPLEQFSKVKLIQIK
jgi:hypothetical protein